MSKLKWRSATPVRFSRYSSRAFTLVEMLVVVAIIGILIGLLFPALSAVRQAARKSYCSANMRQVILATLTYESSVLAFPAGVNEDGGSVIVALLPYLKQEYLAQLAASDLVAGQTYNDLLVEMTELELEVLVCPSSNFTDSKANIADTGDFASHYYGIAGPTGMATASDNSNVYNYKEYSPVSASGPIGLQGLFSPNSRGVFEERKLTEIRDGASYTFGFGEVAGYDEIPGRIKRAGWSFGVERDSMDRPVTTFGLKSVAHRINSNDGELNVQSFSSSHPGGVQFALIDGAIRFVDQRVSVDVLKTFCSIDQVEKPERLEDGF